MPNILMRTVDSTAIVWKLGGSWERIFLLIWFGTFCFAAFSVSILAVAAWNPSDFWWPVEVLETYVVALLTIGAYTMATIEPLHNARIIQEFLSRGWFSGPEIAYASEMVRYLETYGDPGGRIPGGIRWAAANWIAYYATVGFGLIFALNVHTLLGQWTPFAFLAAALPVALGFFVANVLRARRLFDEADARGFRLSKLEAARVAKTVRNFLR